jgi:signal transduction histidine kinase
MRRISQTVLGRVLQQPPLAVLAACLLLATHVGFLLAANFQAQTALRASHLKRVQLDLEKRAASIGYFFSERKNDLQTIATSREVAAYFINKSLGMSETYGLKVNRFVVQQALKRTLERKKIQEDAIYRRLVFADAEGKVLADTQTPAAARLRDTPWGEWGHPADATPAVRIRRGRNGFQIFLAVPCFFQDAASGLLISALKPEVLFTHFIDYSAEISHIAYFLTADDGALLPGGSPVPPAMSRRRRPKPPVSSGDEEAAFFTLASDGRTDSDVYLAQVPIPAAGLALLARLDRGAIEDPLSPWKLLWATGSLSMIILVGVVVLLRFNARRLVLQTRVAESERQKALLAGKNRQLKNEIALRRRAESELESQRTRQMRSDRLRSLGEMAAGIAHELNQPLVGIRGMAEIMEMTLEGGSPPPAEKTRHRVSVILEQVDRMVHIIDHVRRFAREAGSPETRRVDLNDVVRSGAKLLRTQFQSHGLALEFHLSDRPLPVTVNPFSIEEVILNLLSNARDAVEDRRRAADPPAGYTPRVELRTWNGAEGGEDRVFLEVRDNGTGLSPEIAPRLFDPFFTTKAPDKGTGLGLSICKSIVEEFGGRIECSEPKGAGAAFRLAFLRETRESRKET